MNPNHDQTMPTLKLRPSPVTNNSAEACIATVLSPALWRRNLQSRTGSLTLRQASDADFLRSLWSNQTFMHAFHRLAPALPASDAALQAVLQREFASPIERSRALHWVVRSPKGVPFGLLSLTDVSLQHRRAEVLLGVLPQAPFGLPTAAMLMLFHYFFRVIRFNKLYSVVYADNPHSLKSTLHLGFRQEGLLRGHVHDRTSGQFVDLVQTGLLAQDAFSPANLRMMRKLLQHP